ncbi:glycosyltransferase [Planktomarina temperata]|nr:glycosyltransferase [Planktomarina temperata]
MIPKKLHFVWVGDESKRPDNCIQSWAKLNPEYEIVIWGNTALAEYSWVNKKHMDAMYSRELNGVADLMRYEILFNEGGIALDADSLCLQPLEDWLLEPAAFAAWEHEHIRPGLIAAGAMGAEPGNEFFGACVKRLSKKWRVTNKRAWKTVGPQLITDVHKETRYDLTIYPAHFFYKSHHSGWKYTGSGPCFSDQFWGSTYGYENIK